MCRGTGFGSPLGKIAGLIKSALPVKRIAEQAGLFQRADRRPVTLENRRLRPHNKAD